MNKTTKIVIGIIVAIVVIGGIWYRVNKKPTAPTTKEPIKIGATLPLTGSLAYKGVFEKNGIELAVDEINSLGGINGKRLQLIVEDNEGDPNKAVTGVMKLVNIDNVLVVLSAFTPLTQAIAPIVVEKNKVLIYQSSVSSIAQSSDNIFKDYYNMDDVGRMLVKAAYKEGIKSIALLIPLYQWGEDFKRGAEKEAQKLGMNIKIIEIYDPSATDLKSNILKIKEKNPEAILSTNLEKHNIMMMKALYDLNFLNIKLFGVELLHENINKDPISIEVMNKTKAVSNWFYFDPSSTDLKTKNFVENYKKRYNKEPSADAAYFYDDVYILAKVLKICDSKNLINSECIISELKKIKDYPGVAGKVTFNNDGVSYRPLRFFQFINGKWYPYEIPED
jgi:branched-chain amino acid transport system substrate-binding protein